MTALHFHPLPLARIEPITADAASFSFQVPPALRDSFRFRAGQYLTLRATIHGEDIRRSYSICSSVPHYEASGELSVGVKRVEDGVFSNWACTELKAGDTLQVLPPQGRFFTALDAAHARHYLAIAAGSGITPLLSLIATTLQAEPQSRYTLIYGNRHVTSIMFNEALESLKNQYMGRLQLVHLLSRQATEIALLHGRIDEAKLQELMQGLLANTRFDEAFICGPEPMIVAAESALLKHGLPREHVHTERFATGSTYAAPRVKNADPSLNHITHKLTVILDGKQHHIPLDDEQSVLDAALDAGLDLPYSCKGGVCCTCRAKVIDGEVKMLKNFTLEQWEMDKGFVLTCQSRCMSDSLTVSYDAR